MQPVGVILEAVEVVKGRHPPGLVATQTRTIRVNVPWPRHGAYRPSCARGGGVAGAHRREQPIVIIEQPIDRMRGPVGLRTIRGGGAIGTVGAHLQDHRSHRPPAVRRCPRRPAPPALGDLACRRGLRDPPDPLQDVMPPLASATVQHLQDRVEQTPPQGDRGQEPPPRLPRRVPAIGTARARLRGRRQGVGCPRQRALARLQRCRISACHPTHPQETAPTDRGRDGALLPCHPGHLRIGHHIGGPRLRVFDRSPEPRRAPEGQPGPIPAPGITATDRGQGLKRHPPLPPLECLFDLLATRSHRGHDARGAEGDDGPSRLQCDPAYDQVLCDRPRGVVKGAVLVHTCGKQFRVLVQPLGPILPILCRVVHLRAILCCTWQR